MYNEVFHTFDTLFEIKAAGTTLYIAGSLDVDQDHEGSVDLFLMLLAEACRSAPEGGIKHKPPNDGVYGLIVKKNNVSGTYARIGVVHGEFMATSDTLGTEDLFNMYVSMRKEDFSFAMGLTETQPTGTWHEISFGEADRRTLILV
jgi:hypothetical protein